jgi:predicted NUDIX family NTP pyrophosphohydrolase
LERLSAGILLYKVSTGHVVEVLVAHMGGPFWARRDLGSWDIPKGGYGPGEDAFTAAMREFEEELGSPVPSADFMDLGSSKEPSGKVVTIWAASGDLDTSTVVSNTFDLEWPTGSGQVCQFPEVDRASWFDVNTAREKLFTGQSIFLDRLIDVLRKTRPELSEGGTPE